MVQSQGSGKKLMMPLSSCLHRTSNLPLVTSIPFLLTTRTTNTTNTSTTSNTTINSGQIDNCSTEKYSKAVITSYLLGTRALKIILFVHLYPTSSAKNVYAYRMLTIILTFRSNIRRDLLCKHLSCLENTALLKIGTQLGGK